MITAHSRFCVFYGLVFAISSFECILTETPGQAGRMLQESSNPETLVRANEYCNKFIHLNDDTDCSGKVICAIEKKTNGTTYKKFEDLCIAYLYNCQHNREFEPTTNPECQNKAGSEVIKDAFGGNVGEEEPLAAVHTK